MLFLDHDIIKFFYFKAILKKKLGKILNTSENIMENRAFTPKEQMLIFS